MSTNTEDGNLEYYDAKKKAGQIVVSDKETTKVSKSSASEEKSKSDGYVPMSQPAEKQRNFERFKEITFAQKASKKAKQNPLIPIGLLTTVAALTFGLRALSRGDKWQSQLMMRARIGAQGFTIFAVLASIIYAGNSGMSSSDSSAPVKPSASS